MICYLITRLELVVPVTTKREASWFYKYSGGTEKKCRETKNRLNLVYLITCLLFIPNISNKPLWGMAFSREGRLLETGRLLIFLCFKGPFIRVGSLLESGRLF